MEEEKKEEKKEEEVKETDAEDTSPEDQESSEDEQKSEEDSQNIDHKKELEELEGKTSRSELDKARRALYFNAQRVAELGGDPSDILPKEKKEETDTEKLIDLKLAEQKARTLAKSEDEFNHIMWRVKNQNLSVEEAHVLANKGKYLSAESEKQRADSAKPSPGGGPGQKMKTEEVPERSDFEKALLERRGLKFNPKTKTYQGKFTEEYYDPVEKAWLTRRRTS